MRCIKSVLAVITLALLAFQGSTAASTAAPAGQHSSPLLQQFSSLAPRDQLDILQQLAQLGVLQELKDAMQLSESSTDAADKLMRRMQQQLHAIAPQLAAADASALAALREQAERALAADLAAPHRTPSRLARALTLVNIAWFCGCVLVVVAAMSLVGAYVAALAMLVPLPVWEAAAYAASLWVLRKATQCSPATAPYVGLTGCLVLTGSTSGTIALHLSDWFKRREWAGAAFMGLFAAVYGAMAVRLQASLLGTIAVWWAVSALGFSIMVFPFLTVIGFRGGMACPFAASLALILAFLPFKAAPEALPTPDAMRPFETGVWLWCTLVLNVANLIMAHQRWERGPRDPPLSVLGQLPPRARLRLLAQMARRYLLSQVPAVAVIGGTLACGVVLEVEQCRALGAVFGFLWFLSKLAECDWKRVGFAWAALAFGSVLWASAYAIHTWPHLFMLKRGATG